MREQHLERADHHTARAHRAWLQSLPERSGKSLTAIAKAAGIATTTLTRPLRKDDLGISTLNATTIAKIVQVTGVPGPGGEAPAATARSLRGLSEDAEPYKPGTDIPLARAVEALTAGRPNAFPYALKTRALEILGYLPGDVVIVDMSRTARVGDIVCAQINVDYETLRAETVMRIYERAGGTEVLVAASIDQALRQPVPVDDRVAIKGVIVAMLRASPLAA